MSILILNKAYVEQIEIPYQVIEGEADSVLATITNLPDFLSNNHLHIDDITDAVYSGRTKVGVIVRGKEFADFRMKFLEEMVTRPRKHNAPVSIQWPTDLDY